MSSTTVRALLGTLILLVGFGYLYLADTSALRPLDLDAQDIYVADLDFWHRTRNEQVVHARVPLDISREMTEIPLTFGGWTGEDVPQTNVEVFILLEPEQYVQRLYRNEDGEYLWLSLIAGRTSRTFHPPDICYDADGWTTQLTSETLTLPSGDKIKGMWLAAQKEAHGHRVFYVYLFPDSERNPEDGIVLLKLTAGDTGTLDETRSLMEDFLGHMLYRSDPLARS